MNITYSRRNRCPNFQFRRSETRAAFFISEWGGAVPCWCHVHLHIHAKRY